MIKFYNDLNKLFLAITKLLNTYCKSKVLQDYFFKEFKSEIYVSLINSFFSNLNEENMKEYNLSVDYIEKIKDKYGKIQEELKLDLFGNVKNRTIDEKYYNEFMINFKGDFPEAQEYLSEFEKQINIPKLNEYMTSKEEEIKKIGKSNEDFHSYIITVALESYVAETGYFPDAKDSEKLFGDTCRESLQEMSKEITNSLIKNSKEMLTEQREFQKGYEKDLYGLWEEPLDLLECLIEVSFESVVEHVNKILKNKKEDNYKLNALIKIHARALQISNELLALLKAGYPDGANARWRSLYELAVVSFFLLHNDELVSKRYLEHDIVRRYKDALDYQKYYKKLGYSSFEIEEIENFKIEKEKLCKKYGNDFYKDWGWIPRSIINNQNFRALAEYVELDHMRPFFNLSSASVHGLSRGFYRLGIREEYQDKILLCGPSNYGLADPIQNAAISLSQISVCLLNLHSDFETILSMFTIHNFVEKIGIKAFEVQDELENSDVE